MKRRFAMRRGPRRPSNVQWADVSVQFAFNASATGTSTLIQLQAPASLAALTSDPPEDLTILRVKGSFSASFDAQAAATVWNLALIVQDTTWTPGATFTVDADKRILWSRTFQTTADNATFQFHPPGQLWAGTTPVGLPDGAMEVDIAPKVKVEAGKALLLVAYEDVTSTRTLTIVSTNMRVLYKRSGRR